MKELEKRSSWSWEGQSQRRKRDATKQGMQAPLEAGAGQQVDSSREPPEGTQSHWPISAFRAPDCKRINARCFQPLSLWSVVPAAGSSYTLAETAEAGASSMSLKCWGHKTFFFFPSLRIRCRKGPMKNILVTTTRDWACLPSGGELRSRCLSDPLPWGGRPHPSTPFKSSRPLISSELSV